MMAVTEHPPVWYGGEEVSVDTHDSTHDDRWAFIRTSLLSKSPNNTTEDADRRTLLGTLETMNTFLLVALSCLCALALFAGSATAYQSGSNNWPSYSSIQPLVEKEVTGAYCILAPNAWMTTDECWLYAYGLCP